MVQGRGSANSSAKANFAFADEWFQAEGSREGRGICLKVGKFALAEGSREGFLSEMYNMFCQALAFICSSTVFNTYFFMQ